MEMLQMYIPAEIHFGSGVYPQVGACAARLGGRVLVVSDKAVSAAGITSRVQQEMEEAGLNCLSYEEIPAEHPNGSIQEAVQLARAGKVQMIVAVGGMRVSAAARIISLAAANGLSVEDLLQSNESFTAALPCIDVPTAFRNPMLFANATIVSDDVSGVPRIIPMPPGFLRAVVMDPELTEGFSGRRSAALLLDSLLSGIEGYISNGAGFIARPLIRDGVSYCSDSILGIYNTPEDPALRYKACEGGLLMALGMAFGNQGIGGGLAYVLNSMYGVPKSWVAAVLAPHVAEHWVPIVPQKLAELASSMGADVTNLSDTEAARQVPQVLRRFIGQVDAPGRLRDLDLTLPQILDAVEVVMEMDMLRAVPRALREADVVAMVKRAF